ncbi:MAG: amidohydrolase [Gemmatimonadetes bacterium]|nr:amidohydrolase [Gemmatimonadota bacterium]
MIIDCHAHLDERALALKTLVRKMDEEGITRVVLMARITETLEPEKSAMLLAVQRTVMNSTALRPIAALTSTSFYDERGELRRAWRPFTRGGKGYVKAQDPDNESVARALSLYPDRFWGWVFLEPKRMASPLEQLERWRTLPGMVGVKVHPYWHQYPVTDLRPIAQRAQELGLPLLIHLGFGAQGAYRWLIESFPRLRIVFAHAGIPYFKALWPLIRVHAHAFIDVSSPHLSEAFVRRAVSVVGPEKCLYGTDSPYGFTLPDGSYDYARVKGWVERLPVSTAAREGILGANFLRLLDV